MSSPSEAQSVKFKNIVHDLQPGAAVNGRIWNNMGDFRTLGDNQVPEHMLEGAWQTPASIYHATWGYREWHKRDDFEGKVRDLTVGLTSVIARGGNYLLNIGPRGDGSIVPFEANVLRDMGKWINRHQGAVLGASGTSFGSQPWGEVTVNDQTIYLHIMNWPENGTLELGGLATDVVQVVEDGSATALNWSKEDDHLIITLPKTPNDDILPVIAVQLAGDLQVIPSHVTFQSADHVWDIKPDHLHLRQSYADEGNYNSLVRTTVQQSAYFANKKEGHVEVTVDCSVKDEKRNYCVKVGDTAIQVSGRALTSTTIGPFPVKGGEIIPISVTLDKPNHINEDMNMTCHSIHVQYTK